jgi:peptide deformylase
MTASRKDIITLPHADLRQRSRRVGLVTDEILAKIEKMKAAAIDWEAHRNHEVSVALAAVQIDELLRIIIIRQDFDNKTNQEFSVFINPEVTKLEGDIVEDFEGCLSILDVYGKVPRHNKVRVKALGLNGKELRLTAEGFLARVLQHEIDHTKGVLFIDHIKDDPTAFYKLTDEGKLKALDYEKDVKNSRILWE